MSADHEELKESAAWKRTKDLAMLQAAAIIIAGIEASPENRAMKKTDVIEYAYSMVVLLADEFNL